MKKLIIVILLSVLSCYKDEIKQTQAPENTTCLCAVRLYQVSIVGNHILQGETFVSDECSKDGFVFGEVYSGERLIQYQKYFCN